MRLLLIFLSFVSGSVVAAESGEMPPIPYHDWGACPFECCTYREWIAKEPVTVFRYRNERDRVAFRLKKDEQIIALTGVVITQKAGVAKILKPMKTGYVPGKNVPQLRLMPGELVYPLHYAGEGNDVFWYKGRIYVGEVAIQYEEKEDAITRVLSRPVYVWWVKVRNRAGKTGWTRQTDQFDNKDACG